MGRLKKVKNLDIQLKDKVFFVTGGSRGIGKSVVLNLLEEGAYVGTCSRSQKELNDLKNSLDTQLQSRLIVRSCDIRDFKSVKISVNNTVEKFGKLKRGVLKIELCCQACASDSVTTR